MKDDFYKNTLKYDIDSFIDAFRLLYDSVNNSLIKLCEKIVLLFIKKKYAANHFESNTTVYKIWRNKIYIIDFYITPPIHHSCRCSIK